MDSQELIRTVRKFELLFLNNSTSFNIDYDFIIKCHTIDPLALCEQSLHRILVNAYQRPVLNRTERDNRAYSERIFHLQISSIYGHQKNQINSN